MATYDYRRRLAKENLLPALGAGLAAGAAVGLVTGYLVNQLLRRERLAPAGELPPSPSRAGRQ